MGNGNYRTLVLVQVLFKPVNAFRIQVVGRFVKKQHIGFLKQETAECHTATLTTRKVFGSAIRLRATKGCHSAFKATVQVPSICSINNILKFSLTSEKLIHLILILVVFRESELLVDFFVFRKSVNNMLHTFLHNFLHRLLIIQLRFLGKVTHRVTGRENYLTLIIIIQPSNNLHQCRFTSTV